MPGPQGPAGTARAYAQVGANGTLFDGSVGIVAVAYFGSGVYCVVPANTINVSAAAPVATLVFGGPGSITVVAGCITGGLTGIQVQTFNQAGSPTDRGFTIVIP